MRRLVANVEEHPKSSGKFRVRAREGEGRRLKTIASGLSKGEAEEVANAYQHVRATSELRDGVDLATFGIGFIDRRERKGVRGIETDRLYWAKHVDRDSIGKLPVATLARVDVIEWLDRRVALAYRTRVKLLNLLRVALDEAVDREILKANPARAVEVHRSSAASSKDDLEGILVPHEQKALVHAVPAAEQDAVAFALLTGLRQAEQWWLRWEDVFEDRIIVRRSTGGLPPKGGKPREVYLLPMARAVVERLSRRSEWVFPAARGGNRAYRKAPRGWATWLAAAGITRKVRWHDLRHTCATSLLAGWWGRKWTLDEVCKLLGHSSITVTERYARKLNETQRLAVLATPMQSFEQLSSPGGTGADLMRPKAASEPAFVKRKSPVQVRSTAQLVSSLPGEHAGNTESDEQAFLVALGEHLGAVPGGGR